MKRAHLYKTRLGRRLALVVYWLTLLPIMFALLILLGAISGITNATGPALSEAIDRSRRTWKI